MTFVDVDFLIFVLRMVFVGLLYLFLLQLVLAVRRGLSEGVRQPATPGVIDRLAVVESSDPMVAVGRIVDLVGDTTIGRNPQSGIVLGDSFVSGSHAVLARRSGKWLVEDLDSTNGTFVNRIRIAKPTRLAYGDILEVGRVTFKLAR